MLGLRARAAGRQPSELLPPIENQLAESDFNEAVTLALHLFERKQESEERAWETWRQRLHNRELACWIALALMGKEPPELAAPEASEAAQAQRRATQTEAGPSSPFAPQRVRITRRQTGEVKE